MYPFPLSVEFFYIEDGASEFLRNFATHILDNKCHIPGNGCL
jgi:hypothetical protein